MHPQTYSPIFFTTQALRALRDIYLTVYWKTKFVFLVILSDLSGCSFF
jgi:hypothetical protein